MQDDDVLRILVLGGGCEIETAQLNRLPIHYDELVVHDGVLVVRPHRDALIRKGIGVVIK